MKYNYLLTIILFLVVACNSEIFTPDQILDKTEDQMKLLNVEALKNNAIPRSVNNTDEIRWIDDDLDWTEGFWPGICWMYFQYSGDTLWENAAIRSQNRFIKHRFDTSTHDLGFIFNNSFGKAYRITGEEKYKTILIDAANSLVTKYNPIIGCTKSWDWAPDRWQFPVIIDNMMNLELLFEVSQITKDSMYREIAIHHANTTLKNHFRPDFSCFHVVDYDTLTGWVIGKQTHQGFSDNSAWARGQSWGLYGFTLCFRYTRDSVYLIQAQHIADYIISQLPDDGIPPWDYFASHHLKKIKDASAAAILASALIELEEYTQNKQYLAVAIKIMNTLSSKKYLVRPGHNYYFAMKHSVGSFPENSEVDVPIIYGEYYFIEALLRLQEKQQ